MTLVKRLGSPTILAILITLTTPFIAQAQSTASMPFSPNGMLLGTYDDKTKTLTLNSDSEAPDGKPMKMRLETQFNDDETRTFSLYAQADGQKGYLPTRVRLTVTVVGPNDKEEKLMTEARILMQEPLTGGRW